MVVVLHKDNNDKNTIKEKTPIKLLVSKNKSIAPMTMSKKINKKRLEQCIA